VARSTSASQTVRNTSVTAGGPLFEVQMSKNGTPLRRGLFQVKIYQTRSWANFCGKDVEKWYAAVARSAFANQNAQDIPFSGQFLNLPR